MRRLGTVLATAIALLATITTWTGQAEAGPVGTFSVTPNVDLVDFEAVELTGIGLQPGEQEVYQCRGGAVDESDCDAYNAFPLKVEPDGTIAEADRTFYVDARIYLPDGTEVDCRTDPAGCLIGVGFLVDVDEHPTVTLDFDPVAPLRPPVAATVHPSTGLAAEQTVTVEAEHLSFREELFAYLCSAGDGIPGTRCDTSADRFVQLKPEPDGTAEFEMAVRASFVPPVADTAVDCRTEGTECYVVVAWSFNPPPDRRVEVPVSFAPVAPPAAPPAPVPAPVDFTG